MVRFHTEKSKRTKMRHYKSRKNVHSSYWSDVSGAGARNVIQEEVPVFWTSAYFFHIRGQTSSFNLNYQTLFRERPYYVCSDHRDFALLCRCLSPTLAAAGMTTEM